MTVLCAEQRGLPEDPQALRLLLFEAYKPADSDDVEVLGSVVAAYVAWRRVGQMAWGTAEVWQGSRVRRVAARHLRDQLLELARCIGGRRGVARSQPAGVPLAPAEACGSWEWAMEAAEQEPQLLAEYRPSNPVEAMAIALVAQAYGDAHRAQERHRDRMGGLVEEWDGQSAHRQAARHLGEMLRVLQRLQAETRRPWVEVVGVRPVEGDASCLPLEGSA